MNYESFNINDKSEVEQLLKSNDEIIRSNAIVAMVNGIDDREWIECKLLSLINDESYWVAKNAITGLSDLVRIYGEIDLRKIIDALKNLNEENLKGVIDETIEDIKIYSKQSKSPEGI